MPTFVKIEAKPTFRDFQGRFTKARKSLLDERRKSVKRLGKKYVVVSKREAPKGKTGKFAESIGYQTYQTADAVGFRAFAQMPLFAFITEGTRPHIIRGNPILAFHWDRGPEGPGMYFFAYVNHPGTEANPFHDRAWDETEDEIMPEMRKISTRMFNSLKGQ